MEKANKLLKQAMLLDGVCLVVALAVLYAAHNQLISQTGLIIGALIALVLICASVFCLLKSRRLMKAHNRELELTIDEKESDNQPTEEE